MNHIGTGVYGIIRRDHFYGVNRVTYINPYNETQVPLDDSRRSQVDQRSSWPAHLNYLYTIPGSGKFPNPHRVKDGREDPPLL